MRGTSFKLFGKIRGNQGVFENGFPRPNGGGVRSASEFIGIVRPTHRQPQDSLVLLCATTNAARATARSGLEIGFEASRAFSTSTDFDEMALASERITATARASS